MDPIAAQNQGFYTFFNAQSPHLPTPPNSGSIRWTGTLTAPRSGTYRFAITTLGSGEALPRRRARPRRAGHRLGDAVRRRAPRRRPVARRAHRLPGQLAQPDVPDRRAASSSAGCTPRTWWRRTSGRRRGRPGEADVAIVFARTYESEGFIDRPSLQLPYDQGQLIREVARRNPPDHRRAADRRPGHDGRVGPARAGHPGELVRRRGAGPRDRRRPLGRRQPVRQPAGDVPAQRPSRRRSPSAATRCNTPRSTTRRSTRRASSSATAATRSTAWHRAGRSGRASPTRRSDTPASRSPAGRRRRAR